MSERLTTFLKTITDFADEECRELENKAQSFKDENISKYKSQAEELNKSHIEHETSRILSRINREISDYEARKKTALTSLRSSLTEKVFTEATEKIKEFTESSEYEAFLMKSAESLSKAMGCDGITFFVRNEDLKFSDAVKKAVPGSTVCENSEILLGGLRAVDKSNEICGDDTLDSRLRESKRKFAEKSDLKIY